MNKNSKTKHEKIVDAISQIVSLSSSGYMTILDDEEFKMLGFEWDTRSLNCAITYTHPDTNEKMVCLSPNVSKAVQESLPKILNLIDPQ